MGLQDLVDDVSGAASTMINPLVSLAGTTKVIAAGIANVVSPQRDSTAEEVIASAYLLPSVSVASRCESEINHFRVCLVFAGRCQGVTRDICNSLMQVLRVPAQPQASVQSIREGQVEEVAAEAPGGSESGVPVGSSQPKTAPSE